MAIEITYQLSNHKQIRCINCNKLLIQNIIVNGSVQLEIKCKCKTINQIKYEYNMQ